MRLLLRIGVVLLVLAAGIGGNVLLEKGQNDLRILVLGSALVTLVGFVALDATLKRIKSHSMARVHDTLDTAADALAETIRQQWEVAALERGLINPTPVPVRWQLTQSAVAGPASDAVGPSDGHARFIPLPGAPRVQTERLTSGRLQDLFGVYAGLDSGRLIVVGAPGSGKTGTAILLMLDALKYRDRLSEANRRLTPVPVLLNCRGWSPTQTPLADWVADQVKTLYRFLDAAEFGTNAVERLVAQRRIAIFVDGLDEIPRDLRPAVLGALNTQAHCRLVLLSRKQELVDAAQNEYIAGAAALELLPVSPADAADYLARCRVQPAPEAWQRLITQILDDQNTTVAKALNNPLTLTLIRDTFHTDTDTRLLTQERFYSSEAVVEFLLDRVLPAAYETRPGRPAPAYTCRQAQRWLQYVAYQLNATGTRDLAWWQIPTWRPPSSRIIANGFVASLVFGLIGWIAFGSHFAVVASIIGLFVGSLVGVLFEWRSDDRPVNVSTINWRALGSPRNRAFNLVAVVSGLGYGIFGGLVFSIEGGAVFGVMLGSATFLSFMFATGVSTLIAAPSAEADSPIDPMTAWRRDRAAGAVIGTAFGLAFGILTGITFGLSYELARSAAIGGTAGLVAGTAIALTFVRTWDSRLAFLQIYLTGHGPVRLMDFLEDAHHRGVLRTVGPIYQFRHARLQDRLAAQHMSRDFVGELDVSPDG